MNFDKCKYDHLQLADQFLKMAERFLPYAANEKCNLDFGEGNVVANECGTVACHGGYAALALGLGAGVHTSNYDKLHFHKGAHALAEYLGFESVDDIEDWADYNPDIWGTESGRDMFDAYGWYAFDMDSDMKLKDIVSHYLSVAKRLMEIKE